MGDEAYPKEQLLAVARQAGFDCPERLFSEWVVLGLLDQGKRQGRGPGGGRGSRITWRQAQLELLLGLLARREAGWKPRALCELPVASYRLGAADVPARQAKRALMTWARPARTASRRVARSLARELLSEIRVRWHQRAAWEQLVELVADALHGPHTLETDAGRAAAARALRPHEFGRLRRLPGPSDEMLGSDAVLRLMEKTRRPNMKVEREQLVRLGEHQRRTHSIPSTVETGGTVVFLWQTLDGFLAQLKARVEALARLEQTREEDLAQARLPLDGPPPVAAIVASDFLVTGACLGLITTLGFDLLGRRTMPTQDQVAAPTTTATENT